jgi:hypothetical protein
LAWIPRTIIRELKFTQKRSPNEKGAGENILFSISPANIAKTFFSYADRDGFHLSKSVAWVMGMG